MNLLLVAACVLGQASPWDAAPFTAKPEAILAAAKELTPPPGASHEVLLEEYTFRVDDQQRVHREIRHVVHLLDSDAVEEWADLQLAWDSWYQERPEFEARVITRDGKEFRLDPKTIVEGAGRDENRALFSDSKVLRAPLPAVAPGAIIERTVRSRQHRPFCKAGTLSSALIGPLSPTRKFRFVVEAPQTIPLRVDVRGSEHRPQQTTMNGVVRWTLEVDHPKLPSELEAFMPADAPRLPRVVFSTGTTWSEVAKEYATIVDRQLNLGDIKPLVSQFAGLPRDQAAVRCLQELQTHVRYTGLLFGESSIVPHPVRDTWATRYGDCKDQALALVGMLRACGHQAELALLRIGEAEDVVPSLPALNAFNHAIVYVPGEPPLWIDPTEPLTRPGQLPWLDQDRWALIASLQTQDLVRTPRSTSRESDSLDVRELHLAEDGHGKLQMDLEARGTEDSSRRSGYLTTSRDESRNLWEGYLAEAYPGAKLTSLEWGDPRDFDQPFRVRLQAEGGEFASFTDDAARCTISLADRLGYLPEPLLPQTDQSSDEPRKHPFHVPTPIGKEVRFRVICPDGFTVAKLPESVHHTWGPCELRLEFSSPGPREAHVRFRFDLGDGRFSAQDVDAFRRGIREGNRAGIWQPVLKFERTAAKLFREKKFREGLAEHQRLLAESPGSALLHWRYGKALLQLGFGEAAREACRKAVELDPQSATAQVELARCLLHDLHGQETRPGMDLAGAFAATRVAMDLAPQSAEVRFLHTLLMEYDRDGNRYGRRSRLNEAIEGYQRALVDAPNNEVLLQNLGLALLYARRFPEVRTLLEPFQPNRERLTMLLAATAAIDGVPAAFHARDDIPENVRVQALLASCDLLANLRMYSEAAELVDLLAPSSAAAPRLRQLAEGWRVFRKLETVIAPKDDPRRVVQELYTAVVLGGSYRDRIDSLFIPRNVPRFWVKQLQNQLAPIRRLALATGQPPERRADLVSTLELTVEGDPQTGHRILASFPGSPVRAAWYVARRQDEWKLWDAGEDNVELGVMALSRLHHGDLKQATQWLQWTADTNRDPPPVTDQFNGSPFDRCWRVLDRRKAENLELLAAMCASGSTEDARAQTILLKQRQSTKNRVLQLQIDRALLHGHTAKNRNAEALALLERLIEANPQHLILVYQKAELLRLLRRYDDSRLVLDTVCREHPDDLFVKIMTAQGLFQTGIYDQAVELLQPISESVLSDADATQAFKSTTLNSLVWNSLFLDKISAHTPDQARRLQEIATGPDVLHTVATAYAELGLVAETRQVLLQLLAIRPQEDPVDWYIVGRLAEHLELPEVAASAYRRVTRNEWSEFGTTFQLAQRRLKGLEKAGITTSASTR